MACDNCGAEPPGYLNVGNGRRVCHPDYSQPCLRFSMTGHLRHKRGNWTERELDWTARVADLAPPLNPQHEAGAP